MSNRTPSSLLTAALLCSVIVAARPAAAARLSTMSKPWLKRSFARSMGVAAERVVEVRAHDLERARGLRGFSLGRFWSDDGKRIYAAVVLHRSCGKRHCLTRVRLGNAKRVRALALVDLAASATSLRPATGGWFTSGRIKEPPRTARWPVLVVQTEWIYSRNKTQHVTLISLRDAKRPRKLTSIETLSTRIGNAPPSRGRGSRERRKSRPRFNGTRVIGMRLIRTQGKPRLVVTERRISTRFNRCARPEPAKTHYKLEGGRFVMLPREAGVLGGCR